MFKLNKVDVSDTFVSGEWEIGASIKPDKDSSEKKQVTLRFKFVDVPLGEIIASSLKDKRINWQVGGRNKFDSLTDRSIVTLDYKGGRQMVDVEEVMAAKLATMTPEQREAKIQELLAKGKVSS